MDILSVLESHDGHLLKKLRIKKDSAVLAMERGDGSLFVLRIYAQEIPTYRMLEGHSCENLPAVYHCETRDGFFPDHLRQRISGGRDSGGDGHAEVQLRGL